MCVDFNNREKWLKARRKYLGASDSSVCLNISPFKTQLDLYEDKINGGQELLTESIIKGVHSEFYLRELFKLDFPQYNVIHEPYMMYIDEKYNFLSATLDGLILQDNKPVGILEIKTGSYRNNEDLEKWKELPDYYYTQVCHQLNCCPFAKFVIVYFRLTRDSYKESDKGMPEIYSGYRLIEKDDINVKSSCEFVRKCEISFWINFILTKKRPPTVIKL